MGVMFKTGGLMEIEGWGFVCEEKISSIAMPISNNKKSPTGHFTGSGLRKARIRACLLPRAQRPIPAGEGLLVVLGGLDKDNHQEWFCNEEWVRRAL